MLAPALSFIPALLHVGGDSVRARRCRRLAAGARIDMVARADLPIGFLFILAISSLGVYGIVLAGLVVEQQVRAARRPRARARR